MVGRDTSRWRQAATADVSKCLRPEVVLVGLGAIQADTGICLGKDGQWPGIDVLPGGLQKQQQISSESGRGKEVPVQGKCHQRLLQTPLPAASMRRMWPHTRTQLRT